MDLSKVAAKALHNLEVSSKQDPTSYSWSNDMLKKLDDILTSLGEELDSIMVSDHLDMTIFRTSQVRRSLKRLRGLECWLTPS